MADNSLKLAQFQQLTGADHEAATFYLEATSWNLDTAVETYYQNVQNPATPPAQPKPEINTQPVSQPVSTTKPTPAKQVKETRFKTLAELHDSEEEEDKEQNYYAGGKSSGQMIQNPNAPKKPAAKDIVQSVFENAREKGAEEVEEHGHPHAEKQPAFTGTGYRLGATSYAPTVPEPTKKQPPQEVTLIIKFWRTGFSVDDGPLRNFNDPENDAFIREIRQGIIPKELEAQSKGKIISVNLMDKSNEDYVVPKPVLKSFFWAGTSTRRRQTSSCYYS